MKKIILILLSLIFIEHIKAQIFVEKFDIVENCPDAKIHSITDENGVSCALVKIVTTAKGFIYDLGLIPYRKVDESRVGEIWLYVPEGTIKLSLNHTELGSLDGDDVQKDGYYYFNERLKRATCYRMVLTHQESVKIVGPQTPVKLTFNCDVEGAEVILGEGVNAKKHGVISNHQFSITWPKGQSIIYKIRKNRYEDFNGIYKVEKEENFVDIKLKPLFGKVLIKTLPQAVIKLNDIEVGRGSYQGILDTGNYSVQVSSYGYHDKQQNFIISSAENKVIELYPDMIYGSVKVTSTPLGADIYIDGNHKGTTPMIITNLTPGNHKLELRKNSFVNINKIIDIIGDQTISSDAVFTTQKSIQTLREHVQKNHVYINTGFIAGSLNAVSVGVGFFMPKTAGFQFEVGGFYGMTKSDELYWYNSEYENMGKASYTPYGFYGTIGCAIKCGLKFYIIPKIGLRYVGLKSNWVAAYSISDPSKGSNGMSAILGCSFSYTLCPNLVMFITPEYGFTIKESNGYKKIVSNSSSVKKFIEGINSSLGLICYF